MDKEIKKCQWCRKFTFLYNTKRNGDPRHNVGYCGNDGKYQTVYGHFACGNGGFELDK